MIITTNGPQNIGQIKKHFEHGNLFLSPEDYQTESRWNIDQKQLLIDTIFRGLDIPKFYLWKIDWASLVKGYPDGTTKEYYKDILERKRNENDDPNPYIYEVVDGQQRTRTILEFMGVKSTHKNVYRGEWFDPFPSLDETPMAKGKIFENLNADQQTRFEEKVLTVMILENATIDEVREMFLRLQNGTPLKSQQKRDAMGSELGKAVRELVELPFFKVSVPFDNSYSGHRQVASQILNLEIKGKIFSSTSRQLDKLYKLHKSIPVDNAILSKAKKNISLLGKIFPTKNPNLNRSYALSLYWILSKISEVYRIPDTELPKINRNFIEMDIKRLEAKNRDYKNKPDDDIFSDLSISMSSGTDGSDAIITRHDIITQFLFESVDLEILPMLDPIRNFTYEEKLIIFRKASGLCELACNGIKCNREIDIDDAVIDHILPHSKGGRTILENGRLSYKSCNISRGVKDDFDPTKECVLLKLV